MRTLLTCLFVAITCAAVGFVSPDQRRGASAVTGLMSPTACEQRSGKVAATRVVRSTVEPRRANRSANQRMPTRAELKRFRRASRGQGVAGRVTGRFSGTTGEIIEWAAHKWDIDPELLKAQAVAESSWRQDKVGDGGRSFGVMQIKRTIWRGQLSAQPALDCLQRRSGGRDRLSGL